MANAFPVQTNQFLYTVQATRPEMLTEGPTEQEAAVIAQHWAYLQNLHQQETVVFVGRTLLKDEEGSFGVAVFKAETEDAAFAIMESDPAVQAGVMDAQLFPFQILLQ